MFSSDNMSFTEEAEFAVVCTLKGRSNRSSSTAASLIPSVSDEAAAAAAWNGRRCHRSATANYHRTGHRQRHVCHQT